MTIKEFERKAVEIAEQIAFYQLQIYEHEREIAINKSAIAQLDLEAKKLRNQFATENEEREAA